MNNDLISRKVLRNELLKSTIITDDLYGMGIMAGMDAAINKVNAVPAVDAVFITRCKNCKDFEIDEGDSLGLCKNERLAVSHGGEIYPTEDYFCPYGKSRDGE